MNGFLQQYLPNFLDYWAEFLLSLRETLIMMVVSGVFILLFGLIIGTALVVTREGNILENQWVNKAIDIIVNVFRAIPFVILISLLIPITKTIMGTFIGVKGAIFPLIIGATPFFVRQVDAALSDVDKGIIEAAQSMGLSPLEIIFRVYLRESVPALTRSITITAISLLGLTTMGGAVGGGGIGAFVLRYGHQRRFYDISFVSVLTILIFVTLIQSLGNIIAQKAKH